MMRFSGWLVLGVAAAFAVTVAVAQNTSQQPSTIHPTGVSPAACVQSTALGTGGTWNIAHEHTEE